MIMLCLGCKVIYVTFLSHKSVRVGCNNSFIFKLLTFVDRVKSFS